MHISPGLNREWTLAYGHSLPGSSSAVLPEWEYPRTKIGYSTGVSLSGSINQNRTLFFETGLGFTKKRYNTYTFLTSGSPLAIPPDPVTIIDTLATEIRSGILQIPILMQWRIGSNPYWKTTVTSGIVPGTVMRYTTVDRSRTRNGANSSDWHLSSLSFYLAIGMYHPISKNYVFLLEPTFALDFPMNDRTFGLKFTLIHDSFHKKK